MALPADRAIPEEKFPERLRKLIARDAPAAAQMMIARGQVPMPPPVLLSALYQLTAVADVSVAEIALETALRQPIALIEQAAREPLLPVVLDWLATTWSHASGVLDAVLGGYWTDAGASTRVREAFEARPAGTFAFGYLDLPSIVGDALDAPAPTSEAMAAPCVFTVRTEASSGHGGALTLRAAVPRAQVQRALVRDIPLEAPLDL